MKSNARYLTPFRILCIVFVVHSSVQRWCRHCHGRQELCGDLQVRSSSERLVYSLKSTQKLICFCFFDVVCSDLRLGQQAQTVAMDFEKVMQHHFIPNTYRSCHLMSSLLVARGIHIERT